MRLFRAAVAAAFAVAVVGTATPALAGTTVVDTESAVCQTRFSSLQAFDLQEERQGSDEITVKFQNTVFPLNGVPRSFVQGQTRPGTDFRSDAFNFTFAGFLRMTVIEDDGVFDDHWGPAEILCPADFNQHTFMVQFYGTVRDVEYRAFLTLQRID